MDADELFKLLSNVLKTELRNISKQLLQEQGEQNSIQQIEDAVSRNKLLTRKEASEYLKVSYTTLNRWNKLGVLPAIKHGTRVYYRRADIEQTTSRYKN